MSCLLAFIKAYELLFRERHTWGEEVNDRDSLSLSDDHGFHTLSHAPDSLSGVSGSINTLNQADIHDPASYAGKRLSEDDKQLLLTYTWKVPATFKFPATSGQRFNPSWLVNRPWLRYSVRNDSLFYIPCMCFSSSSESPFISSGFMNWKKALGKNGYIDQHKHSEIHKVADERAALFLHTCQPGMSICAKLTKQVAQQEVRTTKGIL